MFTGLVRGVGTVTALVPADGAARLTVEAHPVRDALVPGASIAVDGVCLTVTEVVPDHFTADVMRETLERTTLGNLRTGEGVNLEPALRADERLGGHIVQGHVDGVGHVRARTSTARWDDVVIDVPPPLARYIAEKGSIAVDGVSLTVTQVTDHTFGVSLIPTTLAETTLGDLAVGDPVNLEVDVIAKYVERLLGPTVTRGGSVG